MRSRHLPRRGWTLVPVLTVALLAGCRYDLGRLYALPLDHPPTAADWESATPLRREAAGGRTSRPAEGAVDSDTVHKSTASCHHGVDVPPVEVELRAFHAAGRLYLRVDWVDPTQSLGPVWSWSGTRWEPANAGEDGLGVLWGGDPETFDCARYCHLEDWRRAGQRALADYAMASQRPNPSLDFWVWRAGRGALGGLAEDSLLGADGRRGDGGAPDATYRPNSVRSARDMGEAFGPEDEPLSAPTPAAGARTPGHLRLEVPPGRAEVAAASHWEGGRWSVILSRSFAGLDADDITFRAGTESVFGLAILDAVERDHMVLAEPVRLVVVGPGGVRGNIEP